MVCEISQCRWCSQKRRHFISSLPTFHSPSASLSYSLSVYLYPSPSLLLPPSIFSSSHQLFPLLNLFSNSLFLRFIHFLLQHVLPLCTSHSISYLSFSTITIISICFQLCFPPNSFRSFFLFLLLMLSPPISFSFFHGFNFCVLSFVFSHSLSYSFSTPIPFSTSPQAWQVRSPNCEANFVVVWMVLVVGGGDGG